MVDGRRVGLLVGVLLIPGLLGARPRPPVSPHGEEDPAHAFVVLEGPVLETIQVDRYVYVRVEVRGEPVWSAAPAASIGKGDRVRLGDCAPMVGFHSNRLRRTFDLIYFCSSLERLESGSPQERLHDGAD